MHPVRRSTADSGVWRPDARASLGMAAAAALLVMAGFIALFATSPRFNLSRNAERPQEEQLVFAAPPPSLPPRPILRSRARMPTPAANLPLAQSAWPPLPEPITAPGGVNAQDYLDERKQQNAQALKDKVTGSDLKRNLGKQIETPAISDNQAYRTIDGQRVERGGGGCAESQTQQGSSSPTNHFEVARPITCPGTPDTSQQMGKALEDWAKKAQQAHPPPPI